MIFILDGHTALGTAWWIEVFSPLSSEAQATLTKTIIAAITRYEGRYSRFRSDSLISKLNEQRVITNPDKEFIALLEYGHTLHARTKGHFNLLVGETMEARGYDASYRFTPTPEPASVPDPAHSLHINDHEIRLTAGRVDIGGFGKGYLIDLLAEQLRAHGVEEFLINGGGDIFASHQAESALPIYLEHPTEAGTYIGQVSLKNAGFAASSPFKRRWQHNGVDYNHIVGDSGQFATFVTAPTARDADAFATASLLWTEEELGDISRRESIGVARFSPTTGQLTVHNFPFLPL